MLDITCFVYSDWVGCHKTRRSTNSSIVQILGCIVVQTSQTQATVAMPSGEAPLRHWSRHF